MNRPLIVLNQLCKSFQDGEKKIHAVDRVSLSLQAGEMVSLFGPSGSGKTTLLNLIGGLEKPDSGEIFLGERPLHTLSTEALTELRLHQIGFIFQAYNLLPVLSALENIAFIAQMQGLPRNQAESLAQSMLEKVGLSGYENRRPSELSGGQQQRVAVARALATHPKLVLADEPTANLDSHAALQLIELMKRLNAEEGVTFIISSHDPQVINAAPRRIQLTDGRITHDSAQPN
jgi:putative ABC transport system ATP-binding protein